MSLEDDIQQHNFRNHYQKAFLNILVTANHFTNQLNDFFKSHNITRQQYNVLRILRGQHPQPATVQVIRERMLDKMSDASRIVERLRLKKLINRVESPLDKRTVHVTITDGGLHLLASIDPQIILLEESFHQFNDDEITTLNSLLEKVRM